MKTVSTFWKVIALSTLAIVVTLLAVSRMQAKASDDYAAQGARVSPQAREAADEVGVVVLGGITHGQTLRFDMFHPVDAMCLEEGQMNLTVFDAQGEILAQHVVLIGPNQLARSFFDVNADQLPQQAFDSTGRAELTGVVSHPAVGPGGGCVVAGEVFDNSTGKTLVHISGAPLLECSNGMQ